MNHAAPGHTPHHRRWRGFARDVAVNAVGGLLVLGIVALVAALLA